MLNCAVKPCCQQSCIPLSKAYRLGQPKEEARKQCLHNGLGANRDCAGGVARGRYSVSWDVAPMLLHAAEIVGVGLV